MTPSLRSLLSISLLVCSSLTATALLSNPVLANTQQENPELEKPEPKKAEQARPATTQAPVTVQKNTEATTPALPHPFRAAYTAKYSGLSVEAIRTLQPLKDGTMELRFVAKSWLATIEEVSQFNWSPQGQLIPKYYLYNRSGLGHDRKAELNFDWSSNQVVNDVQDKPWTMSLPDGALDKLGYQLQLRTDMLNQKYKVSYKVADGGRLKTYDFEVQGQEILNTPLGKLKTTRVKRIRDDNERVTILWLANDWDHLLVRIQQREEDGQHYEINLASAELNGVPVKGL